MHNYGKVQFAKDHHRIEEVKIVSKPSEVVVACVSG